MYLFYVIYLFIIGILNGNVIIRYFAIPLTYLEAGLLCDPKTLYLTLSNGSLLIFTMTFIYILMPFLMRLGVCLLTYANVNVWLLKGMEVNTHTHTHKSKIYLIILYVNIDNNLIFWVLGTLLHATSI